jgi:hypothetical protein
MELQHMKERCYESGMVSWKVFNDLYENQYDAFRKLKFFVKAGKIEQNETLALDMIKDLLSRREMDMERIRHNGLEEWVCVKSSAVRRVSDPALLEGGGENGNRRSLVVVAPREPARTSYWSRLKSRITE